MNFSPVQVLIDAQKAVPAVRYAAGVAGVAAVVAIVAGFQLDPRIAVFGTIIVLGLMFVLIVLGALAAHAGASLVYVALFAAWCFVLLTVATSTMLMTSYFLAWPRSIASYIPPPVENCSYIKPLIEQPTPDKAVSSPTTVQGQVSQFPTNSYLWLMVYDSKKENYINASQITINSEKQWRQQVDFSGSMAGSKVILAVILADQSAHMELNRFKESRQIPLNISRCTHVDVTLRGNYE